MSSGKEKQDTNNTEFFLDTLPSPRNPPKKHPLLLRAKPIVFPFKKKHFPLRS